MPRSIEQLGGELSGAICIMITSIMVTPSVAGTGDAPVFTRNVFIRNDGQPVAPVAAGV